MTRRYLDDLEAEQETVEPGPYTVEVVDARAAKTNAGGDMLWLDLKVLGGVDDGRVVSVSCNLPRDGENGLFFLKKRLRGFSPQISGTGTLPDEDQAAAIAERIIGAKVEAQLSKQKEGAYAGSQQLDATSQIPNVAPAQHQQPVAAAVDAPVASNNGPAPVDPPF